MNNERAARIRWLAVGLFVISISIANAQDSDYDEDRQRFSYRVGGQFFSDFTSRVRIDSETLGLGTELVMEDEFSLEESIQVLRFDGSFHFGRRHGIFFSLYDIGRDGSRITERDIQFGDEFFPAGSEVVSEFNQDIIKLAYGYQFLDKPRLDMSASFGLHTMRFDTTLRSLDGSRDQMQDADVPLPVFGLQGSYRFTPKWRLVGSFEWFDVQVGDFDGTFLDALVSIEHNTFDKVGFGFGFNHFGLDVVAGDKNLRGLIDLKFDAAVFYVKGEFGDR